MYLPLSQLSLTRKNSNKCKASVGYTGYPQYGFPWVEAQKNVYGWDGALLSNSPIREVLEASPSVNKHVFMIENYPRRIERLPANMTEVQSRAKDIMFCDKTSSS